jgi:hypothetical protein
MLLPSFDFNNPSTFDAVEDTKWELGKSNLVVVFDDGDIKAVVRWKEATKKRTSNSLTFA